ncbi:BrnT family toxin [Phenylobacterium sp.]|jgi:uncharacterized protein|uniref:BrnT family toxin n=1 Tax=Phenylobacterium sp. TaxID=1871053 RepID=UPI0037C5D360
MRLHWRFEWDEDKSSRNATKHGVSFEDAAAALSDEHADACHFERYDKAHSSNEDRYVTLASDPQNRFVVYCIAWTKRTGGSGASTRIISARMATRTERKWYERYIAK